MKKRQERFGNIDWKDGDKIRKVIAEQIMAAGPWQSGGKTPDASP